MPEGQPILVSGGRAGLVALVLLGAAACTHIKTQQGYVIDPELLASVQAGVDNKASVAKTLGRPTIIAEWDDNSWYYVARKMQQTAFLRPKPVDQTILIVRFAPDGTVKSVEKRGMDKVADITPNSDKTRTLGRETGWLQDLFGNIGQVGAGGAPGGGPQ
jgi:outer membrane protein assembly factor BamE (lipoprotein component of BamABCDE complex)